MSPQCPRCGKTLRSPVSSGGLCAVCLLTLALSPDADVDSAASIDDESSFPYEILSIMDGAPGASTYLAQTTTGDRRHVALELFGPRDDIAAIVARFRKWKPTLARLNHPGIAAILDVGPAGGRQVYVASEYAAG